MRELQISSAQIRQSRFWRNESKNRTVEVETAAKFPLPLLPSCVAERNYMQRANDAGKVSQDGVLESDREPIGGKKAIVASL